MKTTQQHKEFWGTRKIDWKQAYTDTLYHPHRDLIVEAVESFEFLSVLELGCASAPNLMRIVDKYPATQVGGTDINADAISEAKKNLPKHASRFMVESLDSPFLNDQCVDVVLTDMALIYIGKEKILHTLKEMKRIARNGIVLCEFHHTNPFKRLGLKLASGYNAYNYPKLLKKAEFWDIQVKKIPPEAWEGGEPQRSFGSIITARV